MSELKKYYCVESHEPYTTNGNIYEMVTDRLERSLNDRKYIKANEFYKISCDMAQNKGLIPLMERQAKVGEQIRNNKTGEIGEVIALGNMRLSRVYVRSEKDNGYSGNQADRPINQPFDYLSMTEYLVLDGYTNKNEGEPTMTLEQQREALTAKAADIAKEIAEIDKQIAAMPWVPKHGDGYWYADPIVDSFASYSYWSNDAHDNHRLRAGLIKRTEAEAIEAGKAIYYRAWAESLSDVNEEMWRDKDAEKCYAYWDYQSKLIMFNSMNWSRAAGIYFKSHDATRAAIATIGEDLWIKYVLGVQK